MDPITIGASALLPVVTGMIGADAAKKDRKKASQTLQDYLNEINAIKVPGADDLKTYLQKYQSQGILDPRLEQYEALGPSAIEETASDPRLKQQQILNLEQLQMIADKGGYDPTVKADLNAALRRQAQQVASQQQAVQMQQEAKGMASSGANLALQAMASQGEANRGSEITERLAAQAYQNRLAALSGASSLAGTLQSKDLEEQLTKARAKDEIAAFNQRSKSSLNAANIDRLNAAREANLRAARDLANANVDLSNRQEEQWKNIPKDIFDMMTRKAGLKGGAVSNVATDYAAAGQREADKWGSIGKAGSGALSTLSQAGAFSGGGASPMAPTTETGSAYRNLKSDY